MLSASSLHAASLEACAIDSDNQFGTLNLSTGVFTSIVTETGSAEDYVGLGVLNGKLYSALYNTDTLEEIAPSTGALTAIPVTGLTGGAGLELLGSTLTGLYALYNSSNVAVLYQINPSTGSASLIGSTGLGFNNLEGLSTNSGTLYFSDNGELYTLSTSTGAPTLVGSTGGLDALVLSGGTWYAANDTYSKNVATMLDTVNAGTGAVTFVATVSGATIASNSYYTIFGLAPDPLPVAAPEPGACVLFATGLAFLGGLGSGLRKRSA